jgi:pimeloyl-ACP methyl ester carboxylesterase
MFELWHKSVGSGEPLLLIHGMGSSHEAWKLITPELAKHHEVILLDLPGHGLSKMPGGTRMDPQSLASLIASQLESWGYESFHVAGNSLGGWIALEMAATYRQKIKSVTGLAPAGLWLVPETERKTLGALYPLHGGNDISVGTTSTSLPMGEESGLRNGEPSMGVATA